VRQNMATKYQTILDIPICVLEHYFESQLNRVFELRWSRESIGSPATDPPQLINTSKSTPGGFLKGVLPDWGVLGEVGDRSQCHQASLT
jgi:hypothetical protein